MQQILSRAHLKGVLVGIVAAMLAASLIAPSLAFAEPTSAEKQAEASTALASLNAMQEKLDIASNNYYAALDEKTAAEMGRDTAQARIDEANEQISELQNRLGVRARSMYRTGNSTILDLLFGSTTFEAFAKNWDLLNAMNNNDANLVQQTKDLRAEVQEQEAVLAEQERVATEKAVEAKRVKDEAANTISTMQATYDSLSAEVAALLEQERAAQEVAELAVAQAAAAEREDAANADNNSNSGNGDSGSNEQPSFSEPGYSANTGNAIVDAAYSKIGCMYEWAASGPSTFDCSGLVQYCYAQAGIGVGHYTGEFMGYTQVSNPQPGDICTSSYHAGVYIGGGMMIHAPTEGQSVCVAPVQGDMIFVRP